jgi:peptidoglycan hydrolase-like protein with peptidoglycan-binding domain
LGREHYALGARFRVQATRTVRRVATFGAAIGVLAAVAAAAFWAGRVALTPPADPLADESAPVTYQVIEQTIGEAQRFAAVANWATAPLVRIGAPGVVTSIDFVAGEAVEAGDVLFSINLRPAVIAEGRVPAFRDLRSGDRGADVRQLEVLLSRLGFLDAEPDAAFDLVTAAAARAWQASLGLIPDGIVRYGDVLFATDLPVRVIPTESLATGALLSGGEVAIERLSSTPSIVIPLTPDQRNLVPLSGDVKISYPEGTWEAVIDQATEVNDQGIDQLNLVLEAPGGGPACGAVCADWIPAVGRTNFQADVVVVPETTGPVVPTAAIITGPGDERTVRLESGEDVPIEVLAATGGLVVVSGLEAGDIIVLPFTEPPGT